MMTCTTVYIVLWDYVHANWCIYVRYYGNLCRDLDSRISNIWYQQRKVILGVTLVIIPIPVPSIFLTIVSVIQASSLLLLLKCSVRQGHRQDQGVVCVVLTLSTMASQNSAQFIQHWLMPSVDVTDLVPLTGSRAEPAQGKLLSVRVQVESFSKQFNSHK